MAESNGNGSTVRIKSYWLPFIALAIIQLVSWAASYSSTAAKLDGLSQRVDRIENKVDYFMLHDGHGGPVQ